MIPRSTYRLQLSKDFPFAAAAACASYLAGLGVSHVYCSPVLQAARGSTHGYDVVDPTRINEELGGEAGFRSMVAALRAHGIGVVLDVVPNHMATAGRRNPWWWDILKRGRASAYADYFDIDWEPAMSPVKGKVLLGVLEDRYGRMLEQGAITIETGGEPLVRYRDQAFPLSPESIDGQDLDAVRGDLDAFDSLLLRQHYRLAYWRSAQEELNYRRFFTIDTLIGLRVEIDQVLENSHRVIFDLVAGGSVEGLRVDHVDGLRAPEAYLRAVRRHAPDAYLVVEKILEHDEVMPAQFPVHGTTGYDFISHVEGLFVESANEEAMTALYHAFTGEPQRYSDVVRACKQDIMQGELSPDLERLTSLLVDVCERHRRHRDRTRRELSEAIREVAAGLRVYRTYSMPGSPDSPADSAYIKEAVDEAARRRPDVDPELLTFIGEVLRLDEHAHAAESEFTARFQQFTPAVMAKGVEDTAFYRYNRLTSLNEVGGDPGAFGRPVADFHAYCARTAESWPATMLTLATHDTKRSGDVRARIDVLSEIPAEWDAAVRRWAEHNDPYRSQGYPDRALEYLVYQTLVGAWPIDEARLVAFLRKAAREAKVHTSWTNPVAAYEDAIAQFCANLLADTEFLGDLQTFIGRTQIVTHGRVNSLAQLALLLTSPGVPDLYQGSELWDLSLVDPDNRRPVDYEVRRRLLAEVPSLTAADVMARADEGAPKLWLIARLLDRRRSDPELFTALAYQPLEAAGAKARHVVAFGRDRLAVIVPRLPAGLGGVWAGTTIELPRGSWEDVLTGARREGRVEVAALLEAFPVAVLSRLSA
ncbi:MAG TPA: malto-oligosyltrehalose synthase [Candidatus Dormibacteraeota bacterium]|nr:malto-oligosyltrehalose synthase [Candidatus Dormibacteraeota bacterium]